MLHGIGILGLLNHIMSLVAWAHTIIFQTCYKNKNYSHFNVWLRQNEPKGCSRHNLCVLAELCIKHQINSKAMAKCHIDSTICTSSQKIGSNEIYR